jgi:bidirectional [NiFe] hydrogenase diaphorase subunit
MVKRIMFTGFLLTAYKEQQMRASQAEIDAPNDDKRWRIVNATMRRHGYEPHALIETLHTVQEAFGYLDNAALRFVASSLRVPLSHAYGVATFYHFFSLKPPGKHTCVVCMGTACYIKGGQNLIDEVGENYNVQPGHTTADGELSLITARCIGSCGLAPAVVIDNEIRAKLTPEMLMGHLRSVIDHD